MRKTSFFRPFIWTAVWAVLPVIVLSAQDVTPAGPTAPNFPADGESVLESPVEPDLSGIEESIQLGTEENPVNGVAPVPTSADSTENKKSAASPSAALTGNEPASASHSVDSTGNEPVSDDSLILQSVPANQSTGATSPTVSVPSSILSNPENVKRRSSQVAQVRKQETRHASEISSSSRLLMKLSPAESILEGVEQVDLPTFLNVTPLSTDSNRLHEAITAYWEASSIRSEVFFWKNRLTVLKKLSENASETDCELYSSAVAEAEAGLHLARVSLRSNAMRLASLAGYTREVTAKTLPHAGEYDTRYEDFRKNQGEVSSTQTFYHGLVTLYQEQLTAAASAYLTAENLLSLSIRQNKPAAVVLASWDSLNERRKVFFDVLLHFNDAIFNYVLTVSLRRGPEMAQLLVKSANEKMNVSPEAKVPNLPTPPSQTDSTQGMESISPVSSVPVQNPIPAPPSEPAISAQQTVPVPTEAAGAGAGKAESAGAKSVASGGGENLVSPPAIDPGTGQAYEENAAIDLPTTNPVPANEMVPGDEVVPLVPGSDLGAPAVETPPPGTDFVPIGGETGVNTNPSLNSTGNEGASILRGLNPAEKRVTVGKPFGNSVESNPGNSGSSLHGVKTSVLFKPESQQKNAITLEYILKRASSTHRESAVHAYWQYVTFQKQSYVLDYQKRLLEFLSQRILETMKSDSTTEAVLPVSLGMLLEQEFLELRVEQLEVKIQEWKILNRLAELVSWKTSWPISFPTAVTDLKSEAFTLGLDQNDSGSVAELRALPLARQLYFARQELADSFQSVLFLADQIAPPPSSSLEATSLVSRLKTGSEQEVEMILDSLGKARGVSQKYFHLLYSVNAAYSSCILASEHPESNPATLAKKLASAD